MALGKFVEIKSYKGRDERERTDIEISVHRLVTSVAKQKTDCWRSYLLIWGEGVLNWDRMIWYGLYYKRFSYSLAFIVWRAWGE